MTAYSPVPLPRQALPAGPSGPPWGGQGEGPRSEGPHSEGPHGEGLGLDLPHLWAVFRRRLGLFLSALIATTAAVVIVTFQLTPLYDAAARLVINSSQTQALDYSSIISGISPDAAAVDTEVQVILTRKAAAAVAEELDLWTDPEFGADPDEEEGRLARLVPDQLRSDEPEDAGVLRQRTIDRLLRRVEAERAGITYAIVVTATSKDPAKAAAIANAFAERYLTDQLDQKFETYQRVNAYLAGAVERSRGELRAAEDAVEAYRAETGLLSAEGTLLSEQQVSDLQAQLVVQEADLAERRAKLTTVQRRLALGAGASSISAVLQSPVIADLRSKQADLTRRRAELETRYGPLHPQVQNVESEAAELEAQVETETARIVSGLENEVRVAENRVDTLRDRIAEREDDLGEDNVALVRLRELEREADVARVSWQAVRTRSRESTQLAGLAEADARIADPAAVPVRPAFPDKTLNLALGLLLGLGAGGLAVALAEVFDQGLRTAGDVERQLGTKLLAMVPELTRARLGGARPEEHVAAKPLSAFAEGYRTVRSALALAGGEGPRVVAVTSAVSGEAKTVSALSLARVAALSGDRAIILDCDLRRRALSAGLEDEAQDDAPGLAEVLAGAAPLRAAIRVDPLTGLDVLPVSEDRSGLGDLFGGRRFPALLDKLREGYDLVVLDTAPLTAVAETRLAVQAADVAVLCVRWKETPSALARSAAKVLAETRTPLVGAVLTRVDQRAQAGYGYEGSSRYYAAHGKYYFE